MPNMSVLHEIEEAFLWCEENYVNISAEPGGLWQMSANDSRVGEEIEAFGDDFLDAYRALRHLIEDGPGPLEAA